MDARINYLLLHEQPAAVATERVMKVADIKAKESRVASPDKSI